MFKAISKWKASRALRPYNHKVNQIEAKSPSVAHLSNAEITQSKDRLGALLRSGAKEQDILIEAFSIVKEAAIRSLRKTPYDCQLLGALAMVQGNLIQMGTGEGKTLVAPFVAYWQAIKGVQTHICTVNEFLAERDAVELTPLYRFLGLSVSACLTGQDIAVRRQVYQHDVVYGTHGEFSSDYLRDNTQRVRSQVVQVRGRGFVIVDEADSVMIDDARMPVSLFIPVEGSAQQSELIAKHVIPYLEVCDEPRQHRILETKVLEAVAKEVSDKGETFELKDSELESGDFFIDPVRQIAVLTDRGYSKATELLIKSGAIKEEEATFSSDHQHLLQKVGMALAAQYILHRDLNYVVQEELLIPIDPTTGRLNHGRTWGPMITQALEAKEGLTVSPDRITAASIPLQAYFKLYDGISGMSGTLVSDAAEFASVYGLNIVEVPSNRPNIREDFEDRLFHTQSDKLNAVIEEIQSRHAKGQPVLIGTVSVTQSEELSSRLEGLGLSFETLNASNHAREAEILAKAGEKGAITVTTNMAGRGVDILLGGNPQLEIYARQVELGIDAWVAMSAAEQQEFSKAIIDKYYKRAQEVRELGGLHIIGMERYDSKRKDQQLRGRAGRQGDPGSSQFYIALDDPLVKDFAGEKIKKVLAQLGLKDDPELEHVMLSKAINSAQIQAESKESAARKYLIELDDVASDQRRAFYSFREALFSPETADEQMRVILGGYLDELMEDHQVLESAFPEQWDLVGLNSRLQEFNVFIWPKEADANKEQARLQECEWEEVVKLIKQEVLNTFNTAGDQADNEEERRAFRQYVALEALDLAWFRLQLNMEELRKGIHLRGHARLNPEHELRKGSGELFETMLEESLESMAKALLVWKRSD